MCMFRSPAQRHLITTALVLFAGQAICSTGHAQNALGTGNALDNNLLTGSGGVNPGLNTRANFSREIQFRNALVTGNTAGGTGFRGNVGYSATSDFRGSLGSDDSQQFLNASFYSGVATQSISGITGLQQSLFTSQAYQSSGFGGGLILRTPGQGTTLGEIADPTLQQQAAIDAYGSVRGNLRSTSAFTAQSRLRPEAIGGAFADDGTALLFVASPLQGLRTVAPTSASTGVSTLDPLTDTTVSQLRSPLLPPVDAEKETASTPDRPGQFASQALDQHQFVIEQLNLRFGSEPSAGEHDSLGQGDADTASPLGTQPASDPRSADEAVDVVRQYLLQSSPFTPATGIDDESAAPGMPLSPQTIEAKLASSIEVVTREPITIDSIRTLAKPGSLYESHMQRGEELLQLGHWFAAEERFTAALSNRPGDPIASAGRVLAQLGAGLFRSAALNLNTLYIAYPEMIAVRFGEQITLPAERQEKVLVMLRNNAASTTPGVASDAGLLLAYTGFQADDAELLQEGLNVMRTIDSDENQAILKVLESAWLSE